RGRPRRIISTLNPTSLLPGDYLDLSRLKEPCISFTRSRGAKRAQRLLYYPSPGLGYTAFPTACTGFLHYYRDRDAAPLEGGVRFRVTSQNAPASFQHGHDLLLPSGLPWQVTLAQVVCRTNYAGFRAQLLEEDLVTAEQLSQCLAICGGRDKISPENNLFRMNQDFAVNFSEGSTVTVVGRALRSFQICHIFKAYAQRKHYFPWTGSGLARFEPATHPRYAQRRVVHLRITKIVTPVSRSRQADRKNVSVLKPEEGQLLTHTPYGHAPEPWAYDIDAKDTTLASALRVLWDNSQIP
ncbi:hypothetical protein B0H14DRAFT_3733908, partial [Mycena olivaceomarginata]